MMDDPAAHFLLAGDDADIETLRGMVDRLPAGAYGQIFVEVPTAEQIQPWIVPDGMTVSWLRRDRATRPDGGLADRGELAARAVAAWVAEWIPDGRAGRRLPYLLWIGCSASGHVDRLYHRLTRRFDNLHLHHPDYG